MKLKVGGKAAQHFPVLSADCWHWNNTEGRHISAVKRSDWALLPVVLGSHRCFPGFWLPGIQVASLLYCHLRGLLIKKIKYNKSFCLFLWLSLAVYVISVSRNWQILWGVLKRNKIYFGKTLWHGPEVVANRNVCSWSTTDLHAGPCAPRWEYLHHSRLRYQQKNVSKFGDWHHHCSASALHGAEIKVAHVKGGLITVLPATPRTSTLVEGPASLIIYEPVNWASRDVFDSIISAFINSFST